MTKPFALDPKKSGRPLQVMLNLGNSEDAHRVHRRLLLMASAHSMSMSSLASQLLKYALDNADEPKGEEDEVDG